MDRVRVADDFAAIRARMEELKRERDRVVRTGPVRVDEAPVDARRWQIADELKARFLPRKTR